MSNSLLRKQWYRHKILGIIIVLFLAVATILVIPAHCPAAYNWTDIWTAGAPLASDVNALAWDGANLYAGCDNGHVYKNPGGATDNWTDIWPAPPALAVHTLAWDGANLYAGCADGIVYKNPGGATDNWTNIGTAHPGVNDVYALAWDGTNLYAGCDDGNVYKNPGGILDNWTNIWTVAHPGVDDVYTLAWDGANLYAGCDDAHVYKNPGGATDNWADGGEVSGDANFITALVAESGIAYAGINCDPGENNVFRNDFGGGGWIAIGKLCGGAYIPSLAIDSANNVLYAGAHNTDTPDYNVYKRIDPSTGGVTTWLDTTGTWLDIEETADSLLYDGGNNVLYAGRRDGHVYRGNIPSVSSINPPSGIQGQTLDVQITGSNTDFTSNAQALFSGSGITVNSTTIDSTTRVTANISIDGSATLGARDVWVNYTDGAAQSDRANRLVGGFTVNAAPPVVDSVSPPEGPPGTPVTIKGANFGDSQGTSYVTFNGVRATQYVSWSDTEIVVIVPEGAKSGPVQVTTSTGGSNTDKDFIVDAKPLGSMAWIVAEGSTGEGFDTFILMQNPNSVPAPTAVAFSTEDGIVDGTLLTIPPNSRTTLRLSDYMPDEWSISTMVAAEVPIVVERSMYWNSQQTAYPYEMKSGHANLGLPAPMEPGFKMDASADRTTSQYFPEGSTAGFDTWILLFNPMQTEAQAKVTLMDETGPVVEENVTVGPMSRQTVHLNKLLPDANQVATRVESDTYLAAERSMYWDPAASALQPYEMIGGHSTSGSPVSANNWYIAEGSTGEGFETYILLQNPADVEAPVTLTFMDDEGIANQATTTIPAQSRATFRLSDYVPDDFQVSTSITSTEAIVAERSMYWDKREATEPSSMKDGHSCIGEVSTAKTWMVSEGSTGGGFSTFVLITNTDNTEATAVITFMTANGPQTPFNITIGANSRYTLRISDYLPDEFQVSTLIESDRELVVERSMYWDNRVMSPDGDFQARPFECIGGHSANGLDP